MTKANLATIDKTLSENEIVRRHDRLIRSLASRFAGADRDDLCQVGRIALIEAFRTWAEDRSQLWSYARRAVLGAMIDYATCELSALGAANGEEPTDNLSADDLLEREPSADDVLQMQEIFAALTPAERDVIERNVFAGQSILEIREATGISQHKIERLRKQAISKTTRNLRAGANERF